MLGEDVAAGGSAFDGIAQLTTILADVAFVAWRLAQLQPLRSRSDVMCAV